MWIDLIIYTPMYVSGFWALVLLLSSGKKNRPKQFLGFFMILAFGVYSSHAIFFQKHYSIFLFFDPIYRFSSLSVYPMYYWYLKFLTVESDYNRKNLRLFFPAVILSLLSVAVYILMNRGERIEYLLVYLFKIQKLENESFLFSIQHIIFIISRIVFTFQVFIFLIWGRKLFKQYNNRIANFYSEPEGKSLVWVNLLFYSFIATSVMSIIFNLIGRSAFSDSNLLLMIPSAIFSVLIFMIGFQGYMQNYTVIDLVAEEQDQPELTIKEYNQTQLKDKLLELFDNQQIYRQNDLKITHVSSILQTNRTYVSKLINAEFKCTFSDFVNQYRISEARKLMADSKHHNYSLDYVSEASGFGSVNSFIRIFKGHEGITPGKFRDKMFFKIKDGL